MEGATIEKEIERPRDSQGIILMTRTLNKSNESESMLARFIERLPKAELHIHIEGSLQPEQMFEFTQRNGLGLPFKSVDEARNAYQFADLQSFLRLYYQGVHALVRERDFYDLTWAYLSKAHSQTVHHVEMFFDPQAHTGRGIAFETVISGIHCAMRDAGQHLGISSKLVMCFLRDLSEEAAMTTLQQALAFKDRIVAVGLDSAEIGNPPEKFSRVFDRAREEGLLTVAHAGEEGPPEYIWQALDKLRVSRIDHGVRCLEDPKLTARLAADGIPLTVCPLSNVKLRVFKTLEQHNLKVLLDRGLCVTLNSDDPAYFGGYLTENFLAIQKALQLERSDICRLARNSFQAAFLTPDEKQGFLHELDDYVSRS
jgi:adenine deaminase